MRLSVLGAAAVADLVLEAVVEEGDGALGPAAVQVGRASGLDAAHRCGNVGVAREG